MPLSLFFEKIDFSSWKQGHRLSEGGDGHSNAVKDVCENKTALRSESRMECNKGKKYSFLCPVFGYTITGENAQDSIYGWVDRFTICMVPALYRLKDAQIVPYWRSRRTSKAPRSLPIIGSNGKGSIRVRTLPYDCAEVISSRSHKYHEFWKYLTSHCEDYYFTRV